MKHDNTQNNAATGTGIFVKANADKTVLTNDVDEFTRTARHSVNGQCNATCTAKWCCTKQQHVAKQIMVGYISNQSFSFADYYNPERMHFGVLRVLNDDWVAPGMGFGRHPHDNMEIISIPLEGTLEQYR